MCKQTKEKIRFCPIFPTAFGERNKQPFAKYRRKNKNKNLTFGETKKTKEEMRNTQQKTKK